MLTKESVKEFVLNFAERDILLRTCEAAQPHVAQQRFYIQHMLRSMSVQTFIMLSD